MLNKSGLGGWMNRRCTVTLVAAIWCLSAGAAKSHAGFTDCNGNQIPDECDINNDTCNFNTNCLNFEPHCGIPDCDNNLIPDVCDISSGTATDCNGNNVPDSCDPFIDCNGNDTLDACDIAEGTSNDCNANDVPDECDPDCNGNNLPDDCEDCDNNGLPDECDMPDFANNPNCDACCPVTRAPACGQNDDCDGNSTLDSCDIAQNTALDCNRNGDLDQCEDCDGDAIPDECEINPNTSESCFFTCCGGNGVRGTGKRPPACVSQDTNQNTIPDDCEDCNGNDITDTCDINNATCAESTECTQFDGACQQADCNGNSVIDSCEIAAGTASDCNANGVIDSCEDCDNNGLPDECDTPDFANNPNCDACCPITRAPACGQNDDCDGNSTLDSCDIDQNSSLDCNFNGAIDECEDCDGDAIPDQCEINPNTSESCFFTCCGGIGVRGPDGQPPACVSQDLDGNDIPDECEEQDCNGNDIPDTCDINNATCAESTECTQFPGTCQQTDCNGNSVIDSCEIAEGTARDCNGNDLLDACEDCNQNGLPDQCDLPDYADVLECAECCAVGDARNGACGEASDCNDNGVPDSCDTDCNDNGRPDECDIAIGPGSGTGGPVIIGGDDADDHGGFEGGVNERGWLYIEEGFNEIGPRVLNGNTTAVCLGCNSNDCDEELLELKEAFESGFNQSVLPGAGWGPPVIITGAAAIADFFNGVGANHINNTGIIYMPSHSEVTAKDCGLERIKIRITDEEMVVINANAPAINQFVGSGGGLFVHDQSDTAGGFGWLATLLPGLQILSDNDGGCDEDTLNLTPAGQSAFPNLNDAIVSNATPWHSWFSGDLGGLNVLVTGPCDTRASEPVIIGGAQVRIGGSADCNGNSVPDECDINQDSSLDCNSNGIIDECEDCNGNAIPDECEFNPTPNDEACFFGCCQRGERGVFADACNAEDCNANKVPDECEEDCNGNSVADECDITGGDQPLPHIATFSFDSCGSEAIYWLGVDGSSNRLFGLSESRCSDNYGIHVFDIISGGDDLSFDQTLFGSGGASKDCYGALTVSESTDRLFAIDFCSDKVDIYDTATLALLGTVPVDRAGEVPLMVSVGHFSGEGGTLDDQVFISDADTLRISDIATLGVVSDHSVTLGTCSTPGSGFDCPGFDDGKHMVVDSLGQRIFVSDHDHPFIVFDFSSPPAQIFPTFGVNLCEPLGIAPLPDGKLLITDEDDCEGGLFRLNSDLSLDAAAEEPPASGCSEYNPEGVVYDAVHQRIYVADEDCDEIEIFGLPQLSQDCNDNSIPDECEEDSDGDQVPDDCVEALTCPTVDLVVVMDTSGSMEAEAAVLCAQINGILNGLTGAGIAVNVTLLGITEAPGGPFSCLSDDVVNLFGAAVPGSPACCPNVVTKEDWGLAVPIVAANFPWTPGSTRAILAISDEGPEGGDPCEDPGNDRAVITNAIDVANANDVFVATLTGDGVTACVTALAADLAAGTGGAAAGIDDPLPDLANAMSAVIAAICTGAVDFDRDGAGIADECPNDPSKASPGVCGCGVPDTDSNDNGIPDCIDDTETLVPDPACALCGAVGVAFYFVTLTGYALLLFTRRRRR